MYILCFEPCMLIDMLLDLEESWPPEDPDREITRDKLNLPDSPWTYDNGSVNPNLRPSNAQLRQSTARRRRRQELDVSPVPPYHPDYQPGNAVSVDEYDSSSSMDESFRVRRGSEGYEVRPVDREEMLQQYLKDLGEEPDKYVRYIPEPDVDSDTDDETPIGYNSNNMPDTVDI